MKISKRRIIVSGQIFLKHMHIILITDLYKRSINVKIFLNKNLLISDKLAIIILKSFNISIINLVSIFVEKEKILNTNTFVYIFISLTR